MEKDKVLQMIGQLAEHLEQAGSLAREIEEEMNKPIEIKIGKEFIDGIIDGIGCGAKYHNR